MKKILLSILWIFFWLSAFCSSESFYYDWGWNWFDLYWLGQISITWWTIVFNDNINLSVISFWSNDNNNWNYILTDPDWNIVLSAFCNHPSSYENSFCHNMYCCFFSWSVNLYKDIPYIVSFDWVNDNWAVYALSRWVSNISNSLFTYNSFYFDNWYSYLPFMDLEYTFLPTDIFTINYWSTSKEYTITEDIDIFINSPVIKNWNIFTFDWSTWINLFYNNSFDWYNKNKLYLWWNYSYSKWVFTPVCM